MASRPQVEARGFQWKLRRMVDNVIDFADHGTTKPYPKTTEASQSLRAAVIEEMPLQRNRQNSTLATRKRKSPEMPTASAPSRKHYQRCLRLQKDDEALRAKLASHTVSKSGGHFIAPDWIVRFFWRRRARTPAA